MNAITGAITALGDPISQAAATVGKTTQIIPTSLTTRTADFFNVYGPLLTPFTDINSINYALLKSLTPIPVGSPVSASTLSPPLGTSLPTSGASIPFSSPANVRWRIYTLDFASDAQDTPGPTSTSPPKPVFPAADKIVEVLPSSSTDAKSGNYQLLKGDLLSDSISIIPWPSSTTTTGVNNRMPTLLRAFILQPEISIWVPGYNRTKFVHPTGLVGVVDAWSSVFGNQDLTVSGSGTVDDKLSVFSSIFELAVDNVAPEIGKASSILINPLDKTASIAGTVSQIRETTPQLNVQAAIDVGAYIKGVINAAGADPNVNASVVNVGKVLSSIFALPIAVDINGVSRTRTIIPSVPTLLPSIKSLPGSSILAGSLPVGSLNTLIKTDLSAAAFVFESSDGFTGPDPLILKASGPGLNGFRLTPIPRLISTAPNNPISIKVTVTVPTNLTIPGRPAPLSVNITLPPIPISVPTIQVPQLGVFLRTFTKDFLTSSPDVLTVLDPYTSNAFRNVGSVGLLQSFINTLSVPAKIFTPQYFAAYNIPVPGVIGNINSLLTGAQTILEYLTRSNSSTKAIVQDYFVPSSPAGQPSYSTELKSIVQTSPASKGEAWYGYSSDFKTAFDSNISTIMWLGMPDLDGANAYRLRLALTSDPPAPNPDGARQCGSLWAAQPGSGVNWFIASADLNPPVGLGWAKPKAVDSKGTYQENGPENAPTQASSQQQPSWNDEPKYLEWYRGNSK